MELEDKIDYEALLEAGKQNQAYQAEMEKQKALATRLRGAPELAGQMVSGHYVAPNILEVINDVRRSRSAAEAEKAQAAATTGLGESMSRQNQRILARLLRDQQPMTPPAATLPINPITPDMAMRGQQEGMKGY